MHIPLRQQLVRQQQELHGLIKDTEAFIGNVANSSFAALNNISAQQNHPQNVPYAGPYVDSRYFKTRGIVRATATPTEKQPVALLKGGLLLVETATEVYRSSYAFY
jgi:hypothetical protein